ncbi:hypothetical protein DPMN_009478 [Dreissena polymorpha]|uniref:Uncharacterized protein n=1 Tax=Dreissena polymorpha TaxID=45954 RepID=A0A9D4N1B9_DREPO|nr:hypothetical protein DPMN_009478 [Dreissena polymorpha]
MATVSHEAYLTEESEIADVSRLIKLRVFQVHEVPKGSRNDNFVEKKELQFIKMLRSWQHYLHMA